MDLSVPVVQCKVRLMIQKILQRNAESQLLLKLNTPCSPLFTVNIFPKSFVEIDFVENLEIYCQVNGGQPDAGMATVCVEGAPQYSSSSSLSSLTLSKLPSTMLQWWYFPPPPQQKQHPFTKSHDMETVCVEDAPQYSSLSSTSLSSLNLSILCV